ncbi:unnamed protein product, partial [marine sediment metagenome]
FLLHHQYVRGFFSSLKLPLFNIGGNGDEMGGKGKKDGRGLLQ